MTHSFTKNKQLNPAWDAAHSAESPVGAHRSDNLLINRVSDVSPERISVFKGLKERWALWDVTR